MDTPNTLPATTIFTVDPLVTAIANAIRALTETSLAADGSRCADKAQEASA